MRRRRTKRGEVKTRRARSTGAHQPAAWRETFGGTVRGVFETCARRVGIGGDRVGHLFCHGRGDSADELGFSQKAGADGCVVLSCGKTENKVAWCRNAFSSERG